MIGRQSIAVSLNEELLEEMGCFRYLGMNVGGIGRMENKLPHRLGGVKVFDVLKTYGKGRMLVLRKKLVCMKVLYGCKTWMLNTQERQGRCDGNKMFREYMRCNGSR